MYHTTGFTRDEIVELCARVHAANTAAAESEKITWPPILGLFTSVVVTLTYLRRNRIQAEIGESYGVSQSTISRAVTALTPLLGTALAGYVPVAEDLSPQAHYIVDGTLLPCWSWAAHLLSWRRATRPLTAVAVPATTAVRAAIRSNGISVPP